MAGISGVSFGFVVSSLAIGCALGPPPAAKPPVPERRASGHPAPTPTAGTLARAPVELRAAIVRSINGTETPAADAALEPIEPIAALVRDPSADATRVLGDNRLPPESIRRVVRQNAGRFRGCQQRRSAGPQRVVVRFVIGPDGLVARAEEESATFADRAARRCILEGFFALTFPEPPEQRVVVRYPLSFTRDAAVPLEPLPSAEQAAEPPPPGFEEAMQSGQRVTPPPDVPEASPVRGRDPKAERCPRGDPLCSDL